MYVIYRLLSIHGLVQTCRCPAHQDIDLKAVEELSCPNLNVAAVLAIEPLIWQQVGRLSQQQSQFFLVVYSTSCCVLDWCGFLLKMPSFKAKLNKWVTCDSLKHLETSWNILKLSTPKKCDFHTGPGAGRCSKQSLGGLAAAVDGSTWAAKDDNLSYNWDALTFFSPRLMVFPWLYCTNHVHLLHLYFLD